MLFQLQSRNLRDEDPDEVMLLIGINNLGPGEAACGIVARIEAISTRMTKVWPRARYIYLSIPPHGADFSLRGPDRRIVNDAIRRMAQITAEKFVSLDDGVRCRANESCRFYREDRVHFTREGYEVLTSPLMRARKP